MKKLLMVCSLMLLVMTTIGQAKKRPTTTLPIKKTNTDTTLKTTQTKATSTPVILKVDPKVVQKNQPVIGTLNNQNIEQQKQVNKALEEVKNPPPKATIMAAPTVFQGVAVLPKTYKLKITTTDVECIKKSNKHPLEEYRIFQAISYVSGGKTKIPDEYSSKGKIQKPIEYNAVKNGYDRLGDNVKKDNFIAYQRHFRFKDIPATSYVLIDNINNRRAIPFKTGLNPRAASKNIDHTFIYTINESEINDPGAKMVIHTTLGEYSGRKNMDYYSLLVYDLESDQLEVSIRDVLAILTKKRPLNDNKKYLDPDIAKGIMFDAFDGFKLYLTKVSYSNKLVLEGPIRKRTTSGKEKAAVWVRFELVE